jgi:hypothetical protein
MTALSRTGSTAGSSRPSSGNPSLGCRAVKVDFGMIKVVCLGCPLFDFDSTQQAKASFL